jgi:hypothetical protein
LSDNKDCHKFRFSIVRIVASVSIVTNPQDCQKGGNIPGLSIIIKIVTVIDEMQKPNREEKGKCKNNFSTFERRKRNLKFSCPVSRREREIGKYIELLRIQKIRVVKTFPFVSLSDSASG